MFCLLSFSIPRMCVSQLLFPLNRKKYLLILWDHILSLKWQRKLQHKYKIAHATAHAHKHIMIMLELAMWFLFFFHDNAYNLNLVDTNSINTTFPVRDIALFHGFTYCQRFDRRQPILYTITMSTSDDIIHFNCCIFFSLSLCLSIFFFFEKTELKAEDTFIWLILL